MPAMDWREMVERIERETGSLHLASRLRMQVRPVEIAGERLVFAQAPGFTEDLAPELRQALLDLTGTRWQVDRVDTGGDPTLVEREQAAKADADARMRAHPLVEATFAAFPDAEFVADGDTGAPPWRNRA